MAGSREIPEICSKECETLSYHKPTFKRKTMLNWSHLVTIGHTHTHIEWHIFNLKKLVTKVPILAHFVFRYLWTC